MNNGSEHIISVFFFRPLRVLFGYFTVPQLTEDEQTPRPL